MTQRDKDDANRSKARTDAREGRNKPPKGHGVFDNVFTRTKDENDAARRDNAIYREEREKERKRSK